MVNNGQFVKCPASLLKSKISSDAKILYLLLVQGSWEQGTRGGNKDEAVMSNRMISEALGWGKNKPTKVIKELISNHLVNQTNVITKEGHKTFRYHICAQVKSEDNPKNDVAVVADEKMDDQFSNCVGTIERGDDNQAETKVEEKAECKAEEKKADNEVAEIFNYDQSFELEENVNYFEKGIENADEETICDVFLKRLPSKEYDEMISLMKEDNKIGWKKYADGTVKYNVYPITIREANDYYKEAKSKCAMAV